MGSSTPVSGQIKVKNWVYTVDIPRVITSYCPIVRAFQHICNSCNTGTSGLPDMYTRSPRAAGPRAEGGHIRQATSACVTTIM